MASYLLQEDGLFFFMSAKSAIDAKLIIQVMD